MWVFERFETADDLSRMADYASGLLDYAIKLGLPVDDFRDKADAAAADFRDNPDGRWSVLLKSDGDTDLRGFRKDAVALQKGLGPAAYRFRHL